MIPLEIIQTAAMGVGTGILYGIFFRLGKIGSTLETHDSRLQNLEKLNVFEKQVRRKVYEEKHS